MNQVPIKLGPLALLLSVISICLTTLAILSFSTARADLRLAEKYAETVRVRYELEEQGQDFLRQMTEDGQAPGTETRADGTVWKTIEMDGSRLSIGLEPEGETYRIVSWRQERDWVQDTDIGNLWAGN